MSLPWPYYQDEHTTLYCGDCREIVPYLERNALLLADPPYGVSNNGDYTRFSGGQRVNAAVPHGRIWDSIQGDAESFEPSHLLGFEHVILWGANNFAHKLPPGGWYVWAKKSPELVGKFMSDCEVAWCSFGQGVHLYHHVWDGFNRASERGAFMHPTQKPVALMEWCIGRRPRAHTVIDPYMGSGTTAVAAKRAGKRFIGVEIHEPYAEIAARRLAQGVLPLETA